MSVLSIDEARKLSCFREYENGVYEYQTAYRFWHLIVGSKDVLAGLNATYCHYYSDGVYTYKTADGFYHLIIDGKDVLAGLNATYCLYCIRDGVYWYKTEDGVWHQCKVDLNKGEV